MAKPKRNKPEPQAPQQQEGISVPVERLLIKIGSLTLENDLLREQIQQQNAQIATLTKVLNPDEEKKDPTDEEAPRGETVE